MNKYSRGVMFIGGLGPAPDALRKIAGGADILVAADSGLIAAEEAGLTPDWVLGDMDSLGTVGRPEDLKRLEMYPPERVLRYPPDKDYTDTELAFNLLLEKGCDEIWIAGGGGGRTDHLFGVRALFERQNPPDRWFPGNEEIRCLKEGKTLNAAVPPGSLVSVFPLAGGPWEAESAGLKWPLNGLVWKIGDFGLSNAAEHGFFEIRSLKGRFMVIIPHEE